jgi:hypothetical protein
MFRGVKRSVEFSLDLKLENKIPRLDFIEMMEDSYEKSIIDFLAEEFTNELLKDPKSLKERIKSKITEMVYSKNMVKKAPVKKSVAKPVAKTVAKRATVKKDLSETPDSIPVNKPTATKGTRTKKETEQQ